MPGPLLGTILLTGGSGMVGRNIRAHPRAARWRILAPSSRELDLTDAPAVADWIAHARPDLVIHAAGRVGGIQANIAHPVAFLEENVAMGRAVILGAHRAGVRRLLNLASSCIYPRAAPNPLTEEMILSGPLEPTNEGYALAKIVALRLCDYIRTEDPGAAYKTLVPCNLYGPHDKFAPEHSHLVPAILHKLHTAGATGAETVEIWGDGTARREFLFAPDLADAVLRAAEEIDTIPETMNIGVGHDHTINDYYATAARVVGWQGRFEHDLSRPVGMQRKLVSTARQTAWGWAPATPLDRGLAQTYAFYRERIAP